MGLQVYSPATRGGTSVSNTAKIKATCDYCGNFILEHNYWFIPQDVSNLDAAAMRDYDFKKAIVYRDESLLRYEVEEYLREEGNYINFNGKIICKFCHKMSINIANHPNKAKK